MNQVQLQQSGRINTNYQSPVFRAQQNAQTNPVETKKNGNKQIRNALIALGTIAAASVAIAKRKDVSAALKGLSGKIKTKTGDIAQSIKDKAAQKAEQAAQTATSDAKKLPMFDSKNIKSGKYLDSNGCLVVVDNAGTGIVQFSDDVFQVTRDGAQKIYDAAEFRKTPFAEGKTIQKLIGDGNKPSNGTKLLQSGASAATGIDASDVGKIDKGASPTVKLLDDGVAASKVSEPDNVIELAKVRAQKRLQVMKNKAEALQLLESMTKSSDKKGIRNKIAKLIHPDKLEAALREGVITQKEFSELEGIMASANVITNNLGKAA